MNSDPEQIQRNLDSTRAELSDDLGALGAKVDPRQIAGRRVHRLRDAFERMKGKVMGSADAARHTARDRAGMVGDRAQNMSSSMNEAAGSAADRMRGAAASVRQDVRDAPHMAQERAEGSPLAAGLVAFGAGILASALLPRTEPEQQLAGRVRQAATARTGQMKQAATGTAQHLRDDLREPAAQAAQSVKSTAGQAASQVQEEGQWAGRNVKDQAEQARQNVSSR